MGSIRNLWASVIEFRPDPTRPRKGQVLLGITMAIETGRKRFLVLWVREQFAPDEAKAMDAIHRRLLLESTDYLVKEFDKAARESSDPCEVLKAFARSKRACIYASPPELVEASKPLLTSTKAAVRHIFEEVACAALAGLRPGELGSRRRGVGRAEVLPELPDPWTISRELKGNSWARAG